MPNWDQTSQNDPAGPEGADTSSSTGRSAEPSQLTLVYDGDCLLCRRSVRWIEEQNPFVPIVARPSSAPAAIERFGHLADYGENMIVGDDLGRVWVGPPDAYLVVMWAIPGLRLLSRVFSVSVLKPLVGRVFQRISGNRHAIGGLMRGACVHCHDGPSLSQVRQS